MGNRVKFIMAAAAVYLSSGMANAQEALLCNGVEVSQLSNAFQNVGSTAQVQFVLRLNAASKSVTVAQVAGTTAIQPGIFATEPVESGIGFRWAVARPSGGTASAALSLKADSSFEGEVDMGNLMGSTGLETILPGFGNAFAAYQRLSWKGVCMPLPSRGAAPSKRK
jgi:hypothetical protein